MKRRIFAALLIYGFALGSVFFWNAERPFAAQAPQLILNFALGTIGLAILHFRWKRQEDQIVSPDKARDIFS